MVSRTEESSLSKDKKFCECGCRTLIPKKDKYGHKMRYINGHHLLGHKLSEETRAKMRATKLKLLAQGKMKGKTHPNWRGGCKYLDTRGYVRVWVGDSHPGAHKGIIREHKLVMEKHLGRYLKPDEVIHHINGIKTDNRIENLQVITQKEHMIIHIDKLKREKDPVTGRWIKSQSPENNDS